MMVAITMKAPAAIPATTKRLLPPSSSLGGVSFEALASGLPVMPSPIQAASATVSIAFTADPASGPCGVIVTTTVPFGKTVSDTLIDDCGIFAAAAISALNIAAVLFEPAFRVAVKTVAAVSNAVVDGDSAEGVPLKVVVGTAVEAEVTAPDVEPGFGAVEEANVVDEGALVVEAVPVDVVGTLVDAGTLVDEIVVAEAVADEIVDGAEVVDVASGAGVLIGIDVANLVVNGGRATPPTTTKHVG